MALDPILPNARQQGEWIKQDSAELPSPAAWRQFLLELRVAHFLAEQPEADSRNPQGRSAILQALAGLNDFLSKHHVIMAGGLAAPFAHLIQAFYDLSNGHQPEMLAPVPPGRGGITRQAARSNIHAVAARALDEMMNAPADNRMPLSEAARVVARTIQVAKLPGCEKCSGRTVEKWRERIIAAERGSQKLSQAIIDRWRAPLPKEAGDTPKSRADFLLLYLRTSPTLRWE